MNNEGYDQTRELKYHPDSPLGSKLAICASVQRGSRQRPPPGTSNLQTVFAGSIVRAAVASFNRRKSGYG